MSGAEQLRLEGTAAAGAEAPEAAGAAPRPFPPTAEQAAAIDARDRDVFLEAGAGTGKTRVLVDRYCDAVDRDEVEPEHVLAFTFTEKAAAEMRRRVRVELMRRSRERSDPEQRARLLRAARSGEGAQITTIHGFCRRLLAAHPVAAGLDPRFRVLDAEEAGRLARLAFADALEQLAARDDDVARVAAGYRSRLPGLIRSAYEDLRNHGQRRPELPPLQITAFEGDGGEAPAPADVDLADRSYGALRALLDRFGEAYEQVKAERSGVDFDDLQLLALELLERNPAVAAIYRERFAHLLVDEFQDTSPLQAGLVRALLGPATRLFTVGDEFQSIYAFRGADLASFRAERERARAGRGPDAVLPLSGSFRSTPAVLAAVNAIGDCLLPGFRPLRVGVPPAGPAPGPEGPAVELLLTPRDGWKEEGLEIRTAAAETEPNRVAEARFLARRLRRLADDGVPASSMVLLLRAFTHVDAYAEALELAGLDPYVVGGRGYWSSQQVTDALRLLSCVANPLDDEALFGALASPACGASPDALWVLRRAAGGERHIWPLLERRLGAEGETEPAAEGDAETGPPAAAEAGAEAEPSASVAENAEVEEETAEEQERRRLEDEWIGRLDAADRERLGGFVTELGALRARAALVPLDALVELTLERFDYDLAALTLPGGRRRAANLLKLVRLAGEYELHEGRDLRGFLGYAAERAARSDREGEATIAAEDHDGVTVMTIHAAKGLEFDVVAVADLGRKMAGAGMPPELRLAFGAGGEEGATEGEASGPRVGLRLARAGAGTLTLDGYRALNDDAAAADAEEAGRLAYVAASRARRRLLLSGLFDPDDIEGGRERIQPSHSVLARLLPALGVDGEDGQRIPLAPPAATSDATVEAGSSEAGVRINPATPQAAATLGFDLREQSIGDDPPPGGRPPMLALTDRGASAARSLSYAALAEYRRCGYRFLTERVLGLGAAAAAAAPLEPADGIEPEERGSDEEPEPAASAERDPAAARAELRRSRLGFGRAVHELLELGARDGWRRPDPDQARAVLARHGADPEATGRAVALAGAWLDSELLAELRDAGASFRPEVPFRVALGAGTVLRGTIDLLVEGAGGPPWVVDYKTDARPPGPGAELPEAYVIQRALYAHAIATATGADAVASAYFFLADPEHPIRAVLDRDEIAAGRERIEALIARIRDRDFAVTEAPHAALCHDCPARPRLCPHPPELTLAPRPPG